MNRTQRSEYGRSENSKSRVSEKCLRNHQVFSWGRCCLWCQHHSWRRRFESTQMTKRTRLTLEEMQKLARKRGGKCLSKRYINNRTRLLWQCAQGHEWKARPATVKPRRFGPGTWCPVCANERKRGRVGRSWSIDDMRKLASERKGHCLSSRYVNSRSHLRWECEKGHRWNATVNTVRTGSWCPECAIEMARLEIRELDALARERGGRCLSKRSVGNQAPLRWQCAQRHQWKASAVDIRAGHWCRRCWYESQKPTLAEMQRLAREREGKCLSRRYVSTAPMRWECKEGHRWEAPAFRIKRGNWCPYCARESRRLGLASMKSFAKKRGGNCLSKRYVNERTPLLWECKKGHRWRSRLSNIKQNSQPPAPWCPRCRRKLRQRNAAKKSKTT